MTEPSVKRHLAEVSTLYETNAADIAAMLRECADSIDADIAAMLRECADSIDKGANPQSIVAIVTEDDGSISLYGWGKTDSMDTLATLQLAITEHAQAMLGE